MTIDLTPAETTIILKALSTQPYNEVAALIRRIVWAAAKEKKGKENDNGKVAGMASHLY